jgi:phosphatidylinositol alpha-mannosyltransferase
LRIGIVCPYSFDVPGGVQWHTRDLAEYLIGEGHAVSVIAPADDDTPVPDYLVPSGRAVPVRYNGSVARLTFGPRSATLVNKWIQNGEFDVVHIHEPIAPSLALLALWAAEGPVVATFHSSTLKSRALQAARPLLGPSLEKIGGRIAVSEDARDTVRRHVGGDAVVIPNAVFVDRLRGSVTRGRAAGDPPTLAFLGRYDEPRKGLHVLAEAMPEILRRCPEARLLVAGQGDEDDARARMDDATARATTFLGRVSDQEKANLLATADVYVAPHTGGESFGIVLVEAMSVGAHLLASDIPPFADVLAGGEYGTMFGNRNADDLARKAVAMLTQPELAAQLAERAQLRAREFDWSVVGKRILEAYELTIDAFDAASVAPPQESEGWRRVLRPTRGVGR